MIKICGISAVYNFKNAPLLVLDMILKQENRGKDATGISFIKNGKIFTIKESIPPSSYKDKYEKKISKVNSTIAIGHNRNATSGYQTKSYPQESHPFYSSKYDFVIVHNGSVKGHETLRSIFTSCLGHKFETNIDSEIYLHMLEELLDRFKGNRELAIKSFYRLCDGNIIILFADGDLWGIPDSSFEVMRINDNGYAIASTTDGLKALTRYFTSGEMLNINGNANGHLIRLYKKGDNKFRVKLYGDWNEPFVFKKGDWIYNSKIKCDFCHINNKLCESVEIGNHSYDRCYECFKANKDIPLAPANGSTKDYKWDKKEGVWKYVGKELTPSKLRDISKKDKKNIPNTQCGSSQWGYNHWVSVDKAIWCDKCERFYCKGCYHGKHKDICPTNKSKRKRENKNLNNILGMLS